MPRRDHEEQPAEPATVSGKVAVLWAAHRSRLARKEALRELRSTLASIFGAFLAACGLLVALKTLGILDAARRLLAP